MHYALFNEPPPWIRSSHVIPLFDFASLYIFKFIDKEDKITYIKVYLTSNENVYSNKVNNYYNHHNNATPLISTTHNYHS
jgi:hypothetical protein